MMKTYTQKQVHEITDVSENTIQVFAREGIVEPGRSQEGRGGIRLYEPADLVHIAIVAVLQKYTYGRAIQKSLSAFLNAIDPAAGVLHKDRLLNPFNVNPKDGVYLICCRDGQWTYDERPVKDEKTKDGTILKAMTVNGALDGSEVAIIIDVNAIKRRIAARL